LFQLRDAHPGAAFGNFPLLAGDDLIEDRGHAGISFGEPPGLPRKCATASLCNTAAARPGGIVAHLRGKPGGSPTPDGSLKPVSLSYPKKGKLALDLGAELLLNL